MNLLDNSFKAINGKLATKSTPSKQEIMDWLRSEYTYEFSDIQIFPDPQMDNVYLIRNERGGELGILYTEDTGMGSPGSTHPSWSLDEGGGGDELGEWESPEYNLYTNPSTGATVQKYNDIGWTWELPNGEYQGGYRSADEAMQAADGKKSMKPKSTKQDDIGQAIAEQIVTDNYETLQEIPFQDAVSAVVDEVLATLNEIMWSEGGQPFARSEIESGARELVQSQIRSIKMGKAMPAQMLAGLCRSCESEAPNYPDKAGNPSFFYACYAKDFGAFGAAMDDSRKKAYCAWLTKQCTGKYPNQR